MKRKLAWDLASFRGAALKYCAEEAPLLQRLLTHVDEHGGTLTFGSVDNAAVTGNYVVSGHTLPLWSANVGIGGGPGVYDDPTVYLYLNRIETGVTSATFARFTRGLLQISAFAERASLYGYVPLSRVAPDLDGFLDALDIVVNS